MDRHDIAQCALASLRAVEWNISPAGNRFAVVDGFLPSEIARELAARFDPAAFDRRQSWRERKATSSFIDRQPAAVREAGRAFSLPCVVDRIAELTGVAGLEGDPTLYAGGLSFMQRGDFLNPHIDNSHDGKRRRYRRLNLLYYVTPDWSADDGGSLELWDDSVSRPFTIPARFNRLVIMETNRHSWHSVNRITGRGARCCISSYYFTKASPTGDDYYHVTSFMGRPEQRMRRVIAPADNTLRRIARHMGARRRADAGGNHAAS